MTIKYIQKNLANKIQPTLEDIIGPEQTAAIKARTIIEKLQLNRNTMPYTNANKSSAFPWSSPMIALDQGKAFDRMD